MKKLTIRAKITTWFSVLIILITSIMFVLMLTVSNTVLNQDVKETLANVVHKNAEEIEFIDDIANQEYEVGDQFLKYMDAYIEIDDDYLNESSGVYCALYDSNSNLLYGENIINADVNPDNNIQKIVYDKEKYYVLCQKLSGEKLDGLILMGIINENANKTTLSKTINIMLIVLPVLAAIGIAGGYILAGCFLKPIRVITSSAESISDGSDLSKRIKLNNTHDELHILGEAFNKMFYRLEKSFEEEKQFTSDISHELRTPVTTILAQSELTLEKERSAGEYKKALEVIRRQSLRMKNIVNQMLQFSRIERLNSIPDAKEVNLSQLLENIIEEQTAMSTRSIKIQSDIAEDIQVTGNSDLLAQLINNLISNAYKYGKENIFLSLCEKDDNVVLSVKDDGIGIDKNIQDKIFNRFFQADNARTVKESEYSIGLGLSMVSSIAKLHGGTVKVDSEPGKGSTFILTIPKKNNVL